MKINKNAKGFVSLSLPKEIFEMWQKDKCVIENYLNSEKGFFFRHTIDKIDDYLQQGKIFDLYNYLKELKSYSPYCPSVPDEGFYHETPLYIFWAIKEILKNQGINAEDKDVESFIFLCISHSNEMVEKFMYDTERDWLISQSAYFVRKAVDNYGCVKEITPMCQIFVDIALGNIDANKIADISYDNFIKTSKQNEIIN